MSPPRRADAGGGRNPIVRVSLWYEEAWEFWRFRVWYANGGEYGDNGYDSREEACAALRPFLDRVGADAGPRAIEEAP